MKYLGRKHWYNKQKEKLKQTVLVSHSVPTQSTNLAQVACQDS